MTEGTKSYLFGCHQFFMHPIIVTVAWIRLYKRPPRLWELVCIFLHDIGHIGKDYLSNYEEKKNHWWLGSAIAFKLFGWKGDNLVAGHTSQSSYPRSKLFYADKYSRIISPIWWLRLSDKVEGFGQYRPLETWRRLVRENWEKGCPKGNHQIYLDIVKGKKEEGI